VPVEVSAGDCICHSRCVVHGSLPNMSAEPRATLYVGWFPYSAVAGHSDPGVVAGRRRAITTAVALRKAARGSFAGEAAFDDRAQRALIREVDGAGEPAGEEDAAAVFAAPTLSPAANVMPDLNASRRR
jgi:hypothetical protein